jgi:hypothetical protein
MRFVKLADLNFTFIYVKAKNRLNRTHAETTFRQRLESKSGSVNVKQALRVVIIQVTNSGFRLTASVRSLS